MLISGLVLVAGAGLASFLLGSPIDRGKQVWYDLTGKTVAVKDVEASEMPPGSVSSPAAVLDGNPSTFWSRVWVAAAGEIDDCVAAESSGALILRLPSPTRVREIWIDAGLRAKANNRDLQFRPETILVSYQVGGAESRSCEPLRLEDVPGRQEKDLDTGSEVRGLRISVGSVYDSTTPTEDAPVSLREVQVRSRP